MYLQHKNGNITYYETCGDKENPPILGIHGLGAESGMWNRQKDILSDAGYFVILPDMLAHGKSSKVTSLTLEDWSNQIVDLMDELQIPRVIICGISMGGVISQYFAVHHADRVRALIISDSFGELRTLKEKMMGLSQTVGFHIFKLVGRKAFAKLMAGAYKQDFAQDAREYMVKVCGEADFDQLLHARKAINRINVIPHLGNLTIPALVVVGACFGSEFIRINEKIARSLKNARFVVLENSMDPSPMVNPKDFNRILLEFLSSLG